MLVAGNWKLFKGPADTAAFCEELRRAEQDSERSCEQSRVPGVGHDVPPGGGF